MKKYLLIISLLILSWDFYSQTFFQKITSGPIVEENIRGVNSAWGDYDNDGNLDLVVAQATEGTPLPILLYHNNGDGTFSKITNNIISQTYGVFLGVCWGDYDNDGKLDLFLGNRMNFNVLFHNDGNGNFTRILSGIQVNEAARSASASWCDYDRDGWLDLFVSNSDYINDYLYHNNGNGTFTKITSGEIVNDGLWSRGAAWGDYDNDGWPDLFVATDHGANDLLYHNNRNGTFTKITSGPIVNDGLWGVQCAWGDYNNDGWLDLTITLNDGLNRVYRNEGNGVFTISNALPPMPVANYFGVCWADYNNDSYLDLHIAINPGHCYLFRNNLGLSFINATNEIVAQEPGGDGSWADFNNDGKIDLFVTYVPRANLYKNIGLTGNYLICKLKGCQSNKAAIGARISLFSGSLRLIREVTSGDGNENMLWQHFGLGANSLIDSIIVLWPYGLSERKQVLRNVGVNTTITVDECLIGIQKISSEVPTNFSLSQNNPNPFNPSTTIRFDIPSLVRRGAGVVTLKVFDILGREVATLVNENLNPGQYEVSWDASNYPSGVYFYKLVVGDNTNNGGFNETKKMVLVK